MSNYYYEERESREHAEYLRRSAAERGGAAAKYDPCDDECFWDTLEGRRAAEELANDPHADAVWAETERRMPPPALTDADGDAPPW